MEEEAIRKRLEMHKGYIASCIEDPVELLMHYTKFPAGEKKKLNSLRKTHGVGPYDVIMEILDSIINSVEIPDRFSALVQAMEAAEQKKVVEILTGNRIPGTVSNSSKIDAALKSICNMLKLEMLLAHFKSKGIITNRDLQFLNGQILSNGPTRATYEFIQILSKKKTTWYRDFMTVLIEQDHEHLAEIIDKDFVATLKAVPEGMSLQGTESLQVPNQQGKEGPFLSESLNRLNLGTVSQPLSDGVRENILQDQQRPVHSELLQDQGPVSQQSYDVREHVMSDQQDPSVDNQDPPTPLSFTSRQSEGMTLDPNSMLSLPRPDAEGKEADIRMTELNDPEEDNNIPEKKPAGFNNDRDKLFLKRSKSASDDHPKKDTDLSAFQKLTTAKSVHDCNPPESLHSNYSPTGSASTDHSRSTLDWAEPQSSVGSEKQSSEFSLSYEPEVEDKEDEEISLREYQKELAEPALEGQNVVIVAPTGSGKTRVACRIIQEHIRKMKGQGIAKVIFLVNQVALANQQGEACHTLLPKYTSKVITGESQRSKNEYLKDFVDKRDILIVTAGVLRDALVNREIDGIHIFSLMIFDECHHTHSNAAFNQIMGSYLAQKWEKEGASMVNLPQIVGLTASVGVGKARNVEKAVEHIKKLMANLDADIISTVKDNMSELRNFVSLPEEETVEVPGRKNDIFGESVTKLMNEIETRMAEAQVVREMPGVSQFEVHLKAPASKGNAQYTQWVSKLWKEIAKLRSEAARRFLNPCKSHLEIYNNTLIIYNDARIQDALAYLDVEMKRWSESGIMNKDEKKLSEEYEELKRRNFEQCSMNPKLERLKRMIMKAYQGEDSDSRGIVFVKTRDLAKAIVSWMKEDSDLKSLNPIPFLGQTSGGMTKGEQDNALKYFRNGKHKLIVATSVAEEGLDISQCNLVIRYDHVTNEIAMVQSRGRGRAKNSKYVVLAQEGTGMAEKEELNMIREVMMRQAIIKLQEEVHRSPKKVKEEIKVFQVEANLDRQLKSLGKSKKRLFKLGDFELRCYKCNNFICMSSDVKQIQNAHHVVLHDILEDRVRFIPDESSKPTDNSEAGKMLCVECGETIGVICIYRHLQWPVLKIEKFLIVDSNGRQDTCKQWKSVPFKVSALSTNDFKEILKKRLDEGNIDESLNYY